MLNSFLSRFAMRLPMAAAGVDVTERGVHFGASALIGRA
jgi:hypothetical protein